jgi:hypothetical protein
LSLIFFTIMVGPYTVNKELKIMKLYFKFYHVKVTITNGSMLEKRCSRGWQ